MVNSKESIVLRCVITPNFGKRDNLIYAKVMYSVNVQFHVYELYKS